MHQSLPYNSTSVRAIILHADKVLVEWLESKGIAFYPVELSSPERIF
jgi:hypothetical protein